ncbi:MAG: fibronectin type III domain-containing protein [Parcubacteria group bacterium]
MIKNKFKDFFKYSHIPDFVKFVMILAVVCVQYSPFSQAAGPAFTQSDWSGGVTANTATHTDDQTGWTEFSAKGTDVSATATETTLNQQAISKIFSTDTDFSADINFNENVFGSDDAAVIELESEAKQVSAGIEHTCALKTDGTVYCWGNNNAGQLGDNTTISRDIPVQVLGVGAIGVLTDVSQISSGRYHNCALKTDSTVYCWGDNSSGQLGDNTTIVKYTPIQVLGVGGSGILSEISQIATGQNHTCALKTDGAAYCWGKNDYGQLGDNTTTYRYAPIQVVGVDGIGFLTDDSQIAAGEAHTCAIKTDGMVYCWGANSFGQLGDNTTVSKYAPVQVLGTNGVGMLSDVSRIAGGMGSHTCALKNNGTVYCWGYNSAGQLGDNTTVAKYAPVQVLGVGGVGFLTSIKQVIGGGEHTCAIKTGGAVYCWGKNSYGQLGTDSTADNDVPIQVLNVDAISFLSGIVQMTAGYNHSCAVQKGGTVYCWGGNYAGQLGNNSTDNKYIPTEVLNVGIINNFSGAIQIENGSTHTCAIKSGGTVYCWGADSYGQVGDSDNANKYTPVQVLGVGGVGFLTDVSQISAGYSHTCALKTDGTAYCWGYNSYGRLGDNTIISRYTPVQVLGVGGVGFLTDVSQISAGYYHTCALKTDGTAYCWGYNNSGRLGDNTTINRYTPVQVLGVGGVGFLTDVSQISAGGVHSCAKKNDGMVYCWGQNTYGQLGDNTTIAKYTPVQVLGVGGSGFLTDVGQISVGQYHTCATKTDDTIYCWGSNSYGRLGDNTTINKRTPVQVLGVGGSGFLINVNQIAAGNSHTCATKTDGTVYCWGYNYYGQIGDNTTTNRYTPVQVLGVGGIGNISNVNQISVGAYYHTCAMKSDGTVYCNGYNAFGQLGNNADVSKYTPIQVIVLTPSSENLDLDLVYLSSSVYTSATTDLIETRDFTILSFNKITPSNTSLSVDVRAGNVAVPDGTWTSWKTDMADGGDLDDLDDNRYIQFRVNLSTTDTSTTPALEDITFHFSANQSLISSVYDTETATANLSKVQWIKTLPANTDIKFQLRTSSDGADWSPWCGPDDGVSGTCDDMTYFTDSTGDEIIDDSQSDKIDDQYFQYKMTLSSTDGMNVPALSEVAVSYATTDALAVNTGSATAITSTSATGNGNVTATGGENPERFIEWGTVSGIYTESCTADIGDTGAYSCELTGLAPETTYYYRAKVENSTDTAYGIEQSLQTLSDTSDSDAPTITSATDIEKDSVKLHIDLGSANADDSFDFIIEITDKDKDETETSHQTRTADEDGKVTLTIEDLNSDTEYAFRVKYSQPDLDDFSDYSNSLQATTDQDITGDECTPSDLKAKAIFTSQINLSWQDNCEVEDGYHIERRKEGGSFKKIDSVDNDEESYRDKELNSGTVYEYRIRAYRDDEESDYSNKDQATTDEEAEQPIAEIPAVTVEEPIVPEVPSEPDHSEPTQDGSNQSESDQNDIQEAIPVLTDINAVPVGVAGKETIMQAIKEKIKDSSSSKDVQQFLDQFERIVKTIPMVEKAPAVAQAAGAAAGAASAAAAAAAANPFSGSSGFLRNFGLLGRARKKKENWGTVFDSQTRRSIAGVAISILNSEGKAVDSLITDEEGRYGFLAKEGSYTFRIAKDNYELVDTSKFDEFYGELYDGHPINVLPGGMVTQNIALRATGIDWMEEARRKIEAQNSIWTLVKKDSLVVLFYVGLIATVSNFYFNPPAISNSVLLFIYGGLFIARIFFTPKSFGTVNNGLKKPVPFTMISFYDPQNPVRRLAFTISDILGRYYLLIKNGSYLMKVQGQELGGRTFNKMFKVDVKDGVAKEDIVV